MEPCMLMGVVSLQSALLEQLKREVERQRVRERAQIHDRNRHIRLHLARGFLTGDERNGTEECVVDADLQARDRTDGNRIVAID